MFNISAPREIVLNTLENKNKFSKSQHNKNIDQNNFSESQHWKNKSIGTTSVNHSIFMD